MKPKELVRILEENGFVFIRQTGSHAIFKKPGNRIVIVPIHGKDIPKGTLLSILQDANIDL